MPRKQNTKKKRPAFSKTKDEEEEEEEKSNGFLVPDNNLESSVEKQNELILQSSSGEDASIEIEESTEITKLADTPQENSVDGEVSNEAEKTSRYESFYCSRKESEDGESCDSVKFINDKSLGHCSMEVVQSDPETDSEYAYVEKDSLAQSENKPIDSESILLDKGFSNLETQSPFSSVKELINLENTSQEIDNATDSEVKCPKENNNSMEYLFLQNEPGSYFTETENGLGLQILHSFRQDTEDNYESKPYDLSVRPKAENKNGLDLTVGEKHNQMDLSRDEHTVCSDNDELGECEVQKEENEEKPDCQTEASDFTSQQQLLLAHLSKIQQNFVSNLIQYQARFLAHYQQFQQQLMSEANSSSDDNSCTQDEKNEDEVQENCSDSEDNKSSPLIPPLIPAAHLLGNLVPYALYRSLLPNVSGSPLSSFANPLVSSMASLSSQQAVENDNEDRSDGDESSPPPSEASSSLFQHLVRKSNEMAQSNSSPSSSIRKYSILNTLIGSSKRTSTSAVTKNAENSDENDVGNSSFQFKRKRIAFSAKQYELLQTTFEHNNFPEPGDQQCIARQLKAPYRSIKMWFQNKRANARKKLFPGEKGSGRTATGEKIPGDTDTRFYCDKCPSAFICQKYLSNHLDAHRLYTKSCPKCHVVFTHECLLNTHTISKCGNKEDKSAKKECGKNEETSVLKVRQTDEKKREKGFNEEEVGDREIKSSKMNGYHGDLDSLSNSQENGSGIPSSILAQLNSSLPLLTLLQIQKTQEEQKNNDQNSDEQFEQMNNRSGEQNNTEPKENNSSDSSSNECNDDSNDNGHFIKRESVVPKKKIPPLIPSELVKPLVNDAARFAILRQLLTNYQQKSSDSTTNYENGSSNYKSDTDQLSNYNLANNVKIEDTSDTETEFQPKNIPEHLYKVLDSKNGVHRHSNHDGVPFNSENPSGNEETTNETEAVDTHIIAMLKNQQEAEGTDEKRKLDALFNKKDVKLEGRLSHGPKPKRLRRRTTVFTENQHRILYLHFTHCNFPDPSMFRILSKLTGLTPHVIKIWFQNERSRQRRQVLNSEGEVAREKKPYKCRDCGVEFAMPAFLVKHCMRHIPTDNVTSQARKCPICMVEFETQKLHSHFMASHNLSISMEEEGTNEENICHLCKEHFSDLNSLSVHKNEHLKDIKYGDPPQCVDCKTTFVNVLCLEAHMATHYKFKWDHSCFKCKMKFYDKILLESHLMSHSMKNSNNGDAKHPILAADDAQPNNYQSRYLISLIQQISDSKHKPIRPKQDGLEGPVTINQECIVENVKNEVTQITSVSDAEVCNLTQGKSMTNLSFKFIPVKFIPMSSSQPQTTNLKDTKPVVTVISPSFVTSKDTQSVSSNLNIPDLSLTVKEGPRSFNNDRLIDIVIDSVAAENISDSYIQSKMKKVPNLIPISESGIPLKLNENETSNLALPIAIETASDNNTQKGSSSESDLKEYDESSSLALQPVENSDSQVLVYTPYASEYRKRRRTPTHFNSGQRDILEAYYKYDNFPDPNEQLHLSEYLRVPYSVIKTWFQNTRKNHRKHLKESLNFEVGGPFECLDCRVCFVSKIYLESHIRQHFEKQPFHCQLCLRQFPHQAVYDIHKKMGCSKKCKKKHEHIRQFSSLTRTFKLSEKEECEIEGKEVFSEDEKPPQLPDVNCKKRKLSKTCQDSNVKHFKFEFREEDKGESISAFKQIVTPSNSMMEENSRNGIDMEVDSDDIHSGCINKSNNDSQCSNCGAQFDSFQLPNDHHCSSFIPQLLGYKCPQCDETFQSFLSIAEHKEKSSCQRLLPILPAPPSKFDIGDVSNPVPSPTLVVSELINLYPTSDQNINNQAKRERKFNVNKKIREKIGFTRSSICFLQVHYKHDNYPSSKEMDLMSKRLGIEREKVEHWFQKQRNRERRGHCVGFKLPHHCKECSSVFVHVDALREHEKSVHNPSAISIEFMCPQDNCGAKYPNATLLQTHQMEHTNEKTSNESRESEVRMHTKFLEVHYRENNFPSPLEIGFIARRLKVDPIGIHWWFKQRRERHVSDLESDLNQPKTNRCRAPVVDVDQTTTKGRTKDCQTCSAAFFDNEMLIHHQKIHSTNFSLVCWECGADFTSPLVLETHMLQHGYLVPDDVMTASKVLVVNSSLEIKYSFVQLQVLYNHFKVNNYPKKEEVKLVSRRLKVPMKHVQTWFKNQRISELSQSKTNIGKSTGSRTTATTGYKRLCVPQTGVENQTVKAATAATGRKQVFEIGSNKTNVETGSLLCRFCPSEFVSNRLLDRHTSLHKTGCDFPCGNCSSTFINQIVRDTHSLKHYLSSHSSNATSTSTGTGNASELGLKARSKVLDRETKARLRRLIDDCKEANLFPVKDGIKTVIDSQCEATTNDINSILSGNDDESHPVVHVVSDDNDKTVRERNHPDCEELVIEELTYESENEVSKLDCEMDDEDDDMKLVIDE